MENNEFDSRAVRANLNNLIGYLEQHGLPAWPSLDGKRIGTINRYVVTATGQIHSEPVVLPATFAAVREFLGY